jgi:tetratricopeptide (TPR) repeat protein
LFYVGRKKDALKYVQQVLNATPNYSENYLMCGLLYSKLEEWERALHYFTKYEECSQDKLEARVKRLESVIKLAAIFLSKTSNNPHYNLEHFFKSLEMLLTLEPAVIESDTLEKIAKKIELTDADISMIYGGISFHLYRLGARDKAEAFFTKATNLCNKEPTALERLLKWAEQMCPQIIVASTSSK